MVPDYYTGFSEEEVVVMLTTLKAELAKMIASYSTTGDSVTRIRRDEINLEIKGCQKALKKFDPDTYGRRHRTVTSRFVGTLQK